MDDALYCGCRLRFLFAHLVLRADAAVFDPDRSAVGRGSDPNGRSGVESEAFRMSAVNVDFAGRTLRVLLERTGRPIIYHDPANSAQLTLDARTASAPDGFLPAFIVAGEAVWREATGKGFALDIVHDPSALLGYRLQDIGAGTFATVMLASMEAIHQVASPQAIVASDFNRLWRSAVARLNHDAVAAEPSGEGPRP
jgi:hypothetical protein